MSVDKDHHLPICINRGDILGPNGWDAGIEVSLLPFPPSPFPPSSLPNPSLQISHPTCGFTVEHSLESLQPKKIQKDTDSDRSSLLQNSLLSSCGSCEDEDHSASPIKVSSNDEEDEIKGSQSSNQPLLNPDSMCQSPTGGSTLSPPRLSPTNVESSVQCGCHVKVVDHTTRKAVMKLILASVIALLFMVGEVIGGRLANSLAIMTDAAHMLSDFAGFLISLFAIWVSKRPPSRGMTFGWYRAEVLGALVSVMIIWVLTGILFYEAIRRVLDQSFEVNADIMLITASVGVFVNVFMCMVLHQHSHGHGGSHGRGRNREQGRKKTVNINVRAAFIHVIGDLVQSIGVVIAGYIIWFKPSWKLADPICTFLFCILVMISTFSILKDALRVVMEGTPKHIDYEVVKRDLNDIEGVKQAHSLHIWSITLNRTALAAHLALEPGANSDDVLARANHMLKEEHQITQCTLQVESYEDLMDECGTCQEPERTGVIQGLISTLCGTKKTCTA